MEEVDYTVTVTVKCIGKTSQNIDEALSQLDKKVNNEIKYGYSKIHNLVQIPTEIGFIFARCLDKYVESI